MHIPTQMALAKGMSQVPFDGYPVHVMTTREHSYVQRPGSYVANRPLCTSDPVWTQCIQVLCPVAACDGKDIRSFVPTCNNHNPQLITGLVAGHEGPNSGCHRTTNQLCHLWGMQASQLHSPTARQSQMPSWHKPHYSRSGQDRRVMWVRVHSSITNDLKHQVLV